MDPSHGFSPAAAAEAGALLVGLDYNTKLAVGPQGMVYATADNTLYATCQGERLMWTLTNELIEPGVGDGRFFNLRIEADGTVVLFGASQRLYRINPETRAVNASQPIEIEREAILSLRSETPTVSLYLVYDGEESDVVARTEEGETLFAGVLSAELSPEGTVHYWNESFFGLDPPYNRAPRTITPAGEFSRLISKWRDDGGWVSVTSNGLTRFTRNGDAVWTVPIAMDGEDALLSGQIRILAMDDTGVVFSSVLINGFPVELAAIQTDGLPPPMSVCVQEGCNAHRDRWVRPAE